DGDKLFRNNPFYAQVLEDIELLQEAGNEFSQEAIFNGELTPVFFGSALTNFGVQTFLDTFLEFAPEPHGHKTTEGVEIDP
ncbi:peptide chain release factor 3, partial [Streptococcus pyogenes]